MSQPPRLLLCLHDHPTGSHIEGLEHPTILSGQTRLGMLAAAEETGATPPPRRLTAAQSPGRLQRFTPVLSRLAREAEVRAEHPVFVEGGLWSRDGEPDFHGDHRGLVFGERLSDHRGMTVADDAVADHSAALDALERDVRAIRAVSQRVGAAQEVSAVRNALQPVMVVAIKLGAGKIPGADPQDDAEWAAMTALARREVLAGQRAGRDCGLAHTSLGLLDRVDQMACVHSDPGWPQIVQDRVRRSVEASQRGAERGRRLRAQRTDRQPVWRESSDGWHLRHPNDYWLRCALAADLDPDCRHLIEQLQAQVRRSYQHLRDLDWSSDEAAAAILCTVEISNGPAGTLKTPKQAVVTTAARGDVQVGQRVALAMVEHPEQPFNGQLLAVMACDHWRICARPAYDDSLVAMDGSRRIFP